MNTKKKWISGIGAALAVYGVYYFIKDNNKSLNQKMFDQLNKFKKFLDLQALDNPNAQNKLDALCSLLVENDPRLIDLLNQIAGSFFDITSLHQELIKHPYYKQFLRANQQAQLTQYDYNSGYLSTFSLESVFKDINTIASRQRLLEQEEPELSDNAQLFVNFHQIFFIYVIQEIEDTLLSGCQLRVAGLNFLILTLHDYLHAMLKKHSILANLICVALFRQLQLQDPPLGYAHKCDDLSYADKLDELKYNTNCK